MLSQDTTGKTVIPFNATLANYVNVTMGEGSVFIYETADGLRDTTIVKHSQVVYNIKENIAYTGYEQIFDCSKTTDYQVDLSIWRPHIDSSLWFEHGFIFPVGGGFNFYLKDDTFYPINDITFRDSVIIGNNTYRDILINSNRTTWYDEIWYAKNIGIIMKKAWIENNPTAEFYLVDYEIK